MRTFPWPRLASKRIRLVMLLEPGSSILPWKFEHAVKGLGNPLVLRNLRREIAQIHTELRSREILVLTPEEQSGRSKKVRRRRLNL